MVVPTILYTCEIHKSIHLGTTCKIKSSCIHETHTCLRLLKISRNLTFNCVKLKNLGLIGLLKMKIRPNPLFSAFGHCRSQPPTDGAPSKQQTPVETNLMLPILFLIPLSLSLSNLSIHQSDLHTQGDTTIFFPFFLLLFFISSIQITKHTHTSIVCECSFNLANQQKNAHYILTIAS